MSEKQNLSTPSSSVTALESLLSEKGEYDLWSMKMRQYIAITDHILWDIITNGNQTTTDPASPSVHLLSFNDAVDARSLWKAIKQRFGGNDKHQMSIEDANLKFLRSLPSVWHVVVTMDLGGQPGLDDVRLLMISSTT
ncbi:hypothetical protein Tco_0087887 [Tanacetum coccineum]